MNTNYVILEHVGVIDARDNGWQTEVNIVTWYDGDPKYDIREWSADRTKMTRGIRLDEQQARALYKVLERRFK